MAQRIEWRDRGPGARFARGFAGAPLRAALPGAAVLLAAAALALAPVEAFPQVPAAPANLRASSGGGGSGSGGGGSSRPATPASTPETKARGTPIAGRRARAIDTHYCFEPDAAELAALPESTHLAWRLDSEQDFDLCLWTPDATWRTVGAYASCRGTAGALPEYSSLLKGPGRAEFSVERELALMACVAPAGPAGESGDWTLRIAPDQYGLPQPETIE